MRARRALFREWFGITPGEALILSVLYTADGSWLSTAVIAEATGLQLGAVKGHVCHLRDALDVDGIDSAPGQGYRLTDSGLAECASALEKMLKEAVA